MTIEERARDYACHVTLDAESFCGILHGYVKGATEQRKIDIDKACDWLSKYARDYAEIAPLGKGDVYALVYDFHKAMNEEQ